MFRRDSGSGGRYLAESIRFPRTPDGPAMLRSLEYFLENGFVALIGLLVGGMILLVVSGVAAQVTCRWHEKTSRARLAPWWPAVVTLGYALIVVLVASYLWGLHLSRLVILALVGAMAVASEGLLASRPRRPWWYWRWGVGVVCAAAWGVAAKLLVLTYHLLAGHLRGG